MSTETDSDGTNNRVTLRLPPQMEADLDELVAQGLFVNRSEAIRAGVRQVIETYRRHDDGEPTLLTDGYGQPEMVVCPACGEETPDDISCEHCGKLDPGDTDDNTGPIRRY